MQTVLDGFRADASCPDGLHDDIAIDSTGVEVPVEGSGVSV